MKQAIRLLISRFRVRFPGGSLSNLHLAIGFVLLNVLDAFLTLRAIATGGIECNPIMTVALRHGELAFWLIKIGSVLIIAFGLLLASSKFPIQIKRILVALIIAMAGICLWNTLPLQI